MLPTQRRQSVLKLAHSSLTGGHFGRKKTQAKIRHHFTWPGVTTDVQQFCQTCPECQKAAPHTHQRAPLQPLPVITTPFAKIAFDIVGPLPKTKSGFKYLLTSMCYASKYPEAIPLKRVTAEVVAEAMLEVFSRTGLPEHILTDQGSVFVGRIINHLCHLLGIHHIRTSPYHPQSDGMLERWHASLKAMLKKASQEKQHWDCYLKFLLFSYRNTPHTVTGHAPFEIIYGRNVRGPLEVLKSTWIMADSTETTVTDWINALKHKMSTMADIVGSKELVAKEAMKRTYDRTAQLKVFAPGAMVLVRIPQLTGKLDDKWEGPYEVLEQVSPLTYRLAIPGRANRSRVLHVDMLKLWHTVDNRVLRIIVATEDSQDTHLQNPADPQPALNKHQAAQLAALLQSYKDVIMDTPGLTTALEHTIDTKDASPIRTAQYRLAPAWKEQLREEISALRAAGILEPSLSPWSSPILPVRKKEGGIRLCVDFRRINTITVPDPYLMPRIDEIIDTLAEAKFLSTLDLNKGFHQVPLRSQDKPKTAFCTSWGKFQYTRMPFGLRGAPATFQRLMDEALDDHLDYSRAYLDDIVVFSTSWNQHLQHLTAILERLKELGLTVKAAKCTWAVASCSFLGHIVGKGKISPGECKITAIREFRQPQTKSDIRSFLGLSGYYRKFVPEFAQNSVKLTAASTKSAPEKTHWSPQLELEFAYLKDALCKLPTLVIPTNADIFLLQTDASIRGLGAVLTVVRDGAEIPVAFYSRRLLPAETRYSATELEGLAVVAAVEHFSYYLVCRPFKIQTDHRALSFLNTTKHLNGRLAGWALRLQHYSFNIVYRPGKDNANADALSRQAWKDQPHDGLWPLEGGEDVRTRPNIQAPS